MIEIAGFLIVRKPKYEQLIIDRPALESIDNVYYHGLERSAWFDVENQFYLNIAPFALKDVFQSLSTSDNDGTFLKILQDIDEVASLLHINKKIAEENELIVLSSPLLNKIKGKIFFDPTIEWIGYDLVQLGGQSLIRHGIFENRYSSLLQIKGLNAFGLFDNNDDIQDFMN